MRQCWQATNSWMNLVARVGREASSVPRTNLVILRMNATWHSACRRWLVATINAMTPSLRHNAVLEMDIWVRMHVLDTSRSVAIVDKFSGNLSRCALSLPLSFLSLPLFLHIPLSYLLSFSFPCFLSPPLPALPISEAPFSPFHCYPYSVRQIFGSVEIAGTGQWRTGQWPMDFALYELSKVDFYATEAYIHVHAVLVRYIKGVHMFLTAIWKLLCTTLVIVILCGTDSSMVYEIYLVSHNSHIPSANYITSLSYKNVERACVIS